ncbi:MAG: iron-sulfur cluster assembly accessory protein [Rickettsiales bacterium]
MAKSVVTLTDAAADYINAAVASAVREGKRCAGLRVSLKKGGCSGFEYDFSYAEEKDKYDEEAEHNGARIFIDPAATLKVLGSEMDYRADAFSAKLVFVNPNETGACGCGKSVSF